MRVVGVFVVLCDSKKTNLALVWLESKNSSPSKIDNVLVKKKVGMPIFWRAYILVSNLSNVKDLREPMATTHGYSWPIGPHGTGPGMGTVTSRHDTNQHG